MIYPITPTGAVVRFDACNCGGNPGGDDTHDPQCNVLHDNQCESEYVAGAGAHTPCRCEDRRDGQPEVNHDPVNHPSHYVSHPSGVECIQITEHMNFNLGNAVKYVWRADGKGGIEDLRKAVWYLEREIGRLARGGVKS